MILKFFSWLLPYQKPIAHFPRLPALREEDVRNATRDELHLMERGLARKPSEARLLMEEHNASHALDVIRALERRGGGRWKRRLQSALMKIEGSSRRNPALFNDRDNEIVYRVRYKP